MGECDLGILYSSSLLDLELSLDLRHSLLRPSEVSLLRRRFDVLWLGSGGTTCLTLLVCHLFSSKVVNHVAN